MKKIMIALLWTLNVFSADIAWQETFAAAQAKAKQESKPIWVLITSEQCRWCRKFEATTLQEDNVVEQINSHFIPVHVTRDKSVYPKQLTAKMVPMNYFLDENGKIIYSMPGYWGSEDYQSILEDALRKYKK